MSEMDFAKMMFGWANEPASEEASSYDPASTIRYGTVVAVNGGGTIDVQLDGTGEIITVETDVPHAVGDRVAIANKGGTYFVYGMDGLVSEVRDGHLQLAEQIREKGEEILASAQADLKEVEDAFDAFKAEHTLTDEDIEKIVTDTATEVSVEFSAQIDGLDETYATRSYVEQSIEGLKIEVSEEYAKTTDLGEMGVSLESKIEQTSAAIQAEVSERESAVTGALIEAKSYTDQQADSITSTVTRDVTDAMGETYATKTEVEQASDALHVTVSGEISSAKSSLSSDISTAQGTANSAKSTAASASSFIETHFEATTSGLTISSSASSYKARVSPSSFDILNPSDAEVLTMGVTGGHPSIEASYGTYLTLRGNGSYGWLKLGSMIRVEGATDDFGLAREAGGISSSALGYYKAWWYLYLNSSGTTGTVSLSVSAAKFETVLIVYKDSNGYHHSTFAYKGSSSSTVYAALTSSNTTDTGASYVESKTVKVGTTTITVVDGGRSYIPKGGGSSINSAYNTSLISVVAVFGLHT